MRQVTINIHRRGTLLALFAVGILVVGLLALMGAKPALAVSRSFESASNSPFAVGSTPTTVTNADFNADGKMDLAAQNSGSNTVSVRLGNGDGTFQNARLAKNSGTITSIDTNDSGDIVATDYNSNIVSMLRNNGNGTFSSGQSFTVGSNPSAVTSADLNGDTKADLAVSNFGSDNVSVLFNDGSSGFQPAQNFPAGDGPAFVIDARLNTDAFPDLAVANQNSNNVSVLLNTVPAPETTITRGPPDPDNNTTATFEFSSSEPGSTFQCALDNPTAYSPCTSPKTVPDEGVLADGRHTFYVKATSATGNKTDPTPATHSWRVDATAPTVDTVSPTNGAMGVALATNVDATFSEEMNSSTLTASNFTLKTQNASTTVAATVSYDSASRKATLDPNSNLAPTDLSTDI